MTTLSRHVYAGGVSDFCWSNASWRLQQSGGEEWVAEGRPAVPPPSPVQTPSAHVCGFSDVASVTLGTEP